MNNVRVRMCMKGIINPIMHLCLNQRTIVFVNVQGDKTSSLKNVKCYTWLL